MPYIRPVLRAAPWIVDDLRAKLPPAYMRMPEIRRLLALSDTTLLDESEVLAALLYLESRGEVQRATDRGWKRIEPSNLNSLQCCSGGRPNLSGSPATTLFDQHVTYDKEGRVV